MVGEINLNSKKYDNNENSADQVSNNFFCFCVQKSKEIRLSRTDPRII